MHMAPEELDRFGRVWLRDALSDHDLAPLEALANAKLPGARLDISSVAQSAIGSAGVLARRLAAVQPGARPVRLVAFNKAAHTNWGVPWHQDRVIAVRDRIETPGFGNWSRKSGVWHCEPPHGILENMLFVRVHLDDTDAANGAMEIALGSHRAGIVGSADAERVAMSGETEVCTARRGDVLVLKMTILHRSGAAERPAARRVLRVDYANSDLPPPLRWNE